jgi:hypothetical protein
MPELLIPKAAWAAAARKLYVGDPDMEVDKFERLLDDPRLTPPPPSAPPKPPVDVTNPPRNLSHDIAWTLLMLAVEASIPIRRSGCRA